MGLSLIDFLFHICGDLRICFLDSSCAPGLGRYGRNCQASGGTAGISRGAPSAISVTNSPRPQIFAWHRKQAVFQSASLCAFGRLGVAVGLRLCADSLGLAVKARREELLDLRLLSIRKA